MEKRKINWQTLLFGLFWTGYTLYTLYQYYFGNLESFRVPKILGLFYNSIGFLPTMILQLILGIFLILMGISQKENNEETEIENEENLK